MLAERARVASEGFRRQGAEWDEAQALALPVEQIALAVRRMVGAAAGRLLDIGTGTGHLLETLAPQIEVGLGVDASRAMLALARSRLSQPGLGHCAVRQADMYRLPFSAGSFDTAVLQMVLHYAEDPAAAITEAARVLRPGGLLLVVDLVRHGAAEQVARLAHRWPGFDDAAVARLMQDAGLAAGEAITVAGPLDVRLWPGVARGVAADAVARAEAMA